MQGTVGCQATHETFKPNKINIKASVLVLERREMDDEDLDEDYPVVFCRIASLGYQGSGEEIRGFDFERLVQETLSAMLILEGEGVRSGYNWTAVDVSVSQIAEDGYFRLDPRRIPSATAGWCEESGCFEFDSDRPRTESSCRSVRG
jgi:hypothetical protein